MDDILELIKSRRTIKKFLPKFVSWDNVTKIIEAARHAPSCGNVQNWRFIVLFEAETRQAMAELCHEQYDLAQAPIIIIVCAEPEKAERYYGLRGERLYTIQNCAAAVQNMLLEAHSLGIGTRWIGAFDEEGVKSLCKIPEEVRPQSIIALGYPKEVPPKPPKYPIESLIFFHKWKNRVRDPAKYMYEIATILSRKRENVQDFVKEKVQFVVDKAKGKVMSEKQKE
jgi:nitroreductase